MFLEKLTYGGKVFLFGFAIVFICLILLLGYILLQTVFMKIGKKRANKVKKLPSKSKGKPSNDFVGQVVLDEKKVIAAVTGALSVYLGTSAGNIVIRSYRRIGSNAPAWRQAGRRDQIFNKF